MKLSFLAALLIVSASWAAAQSTSPSTTQAASDAGPLNIHITAVQGGAEYRQPGEQKWHTVSKGMDFTEGVEFRTGPRGTVQLTIGNDQVFRVDRLAVVKVMRAALLPDGTIKTDVGMTYGRVSKDVDLPSHPHQDTIITPSSTLAVRGTEVSLYDQPPYAPEAVSLIGTAVYQHKLDHAILFGTSKETVKKGVKVPAVISGNDVSPFQTSVNSQAVAPLGQFAGLTASEEVSQYINGGGPGVFGLPPGQLTRSQAVALNTRSILGSLPIPGELFFDFFWESPTVPGTQVNFTVTSPAHDSVSSSSPTVTAPSGGAYGIGSSNTASSSPSSNVAGTGYAGFQYVTWGTTNPRSSYPNGPYTITAQLVTTSFNGSPVTLSTAFVAQQLNPGGSSGASSEVNLTLSASNPTETYTVAAPLANNRRIPHNP